jgi:DNA-binding FadR family transcriptional regulator
VICLAIPVIPAASLKLCAPKLTEVVAQQLLDILRNLPEGARVPSERELTSELGVGRSTLRDNLHGLQLLGEIEIRHGQGAFVSKPAWAGSVRFQASPGERGPAAPHWRDNANLAARRMAAHVAAMAGHYRKAGEA